MTHPLIIRRADLRPASLDREARSVEAVASTGTGVARRDARGPFTERLDLAAIDPSSLRGITVLDAHQQGSTRDAVGVIEAARIEDGALIVALRIARGKDGDALLDKIEDGVLRGVSIGYRVASWAETTENRQRIRTATRWEIVELSLVPVPADPGATIRSLPVEDDETEILEREDVPPANRADVNREIRSIASLAGLSRDWSDGQIDAGATAEQPRAAAFEAMRTRPQANIRAQVIRQNDAPEQYRAQRAEALYARANPGHELSEPARRYAGDSQTDIARDCLARSGHSVTGLSGGELVTRALHTTSDFALILGDAVGRSLREAYRAVPSGLKQVARQTTARDFRAKHRLQLGEAPTLEKVNEHGEYERGTMAEAEETYSVDTFGRIIGITRKAIVNDDLGAFSNLSGRIGAAAAAFEATQLVQLLEANVAMNDGAALFHADHSNLAASGAVISEESLSTARLAMRKQTGLSGDLIDVTPYAVIVPPDLETVAEKVLSQVQAAKTDDVNPFASLMLIVEPRLTSAARWYLAANPSTADGLEYAYLEGAQGPQIETRQGFNVDGVEIKVRLDFGAGFVDWRAWYRNDGE